VSIDGAKLSPASLLAKLNDLGRANGIGRIDLVENRFVGMKSRGVYETPGGTILLAAHRAIESITLDRGAAHLKDELMPRYAELIYNGFWFSPEREMLQAAIDKSQEFVSGTVRLKLYKGNVIVMGRSSPLYSLLQGAKGCGRPRQPSMRRRKTTRAPTTRKTRSRNGFIKLNAFAAAHAPRCAGASGGAEGIDRGGRHLRDILARAGFRDIKLEKFDGAMNMGDTAAEAANEALNIGPLARAAAELDEATRAKILGVVTTAMQKFAGPRGVAPPAACWLVSAKG
jgi:hypothetical protein